MHLLAQLAAVATAGSVAAVVAAPRHSRTSSTSGPPLAAVTVAVGRCAAYAAKRRDRARRTNNSRRHIGSRSFLQSRRRIGRCAVYAHMRRIGRKRRRRWHLRISSRRPRRSRRRDGPSRRPPGHRSNRRRTQKAHPSPHPITQLARVARAGSAAALRTPTMAT